MQRMVAATLLSLACAVTGARAAAAGNALQEAVQDARRTPAFVARDPVRHPGAELAFFRLRPNATVVEIEPGGGYWTEILAPYLYEHGTYYVALPTDAGMAKDVTSFRAKVAADPARFGHIRLTRIGIGHDVIAPPNSADAVLTFRNLHNWMGDGHAAESFAAIHAALKPGGLLGIEEHRGSNATPQDPKAASGYVRQDYAIALIERAGFKLVASSELLANPRDTKDYPSGVWTLPPTFTLGAKDHARYAAIGEADNFLLVFRK